MFKQITLSKKEIIVFIFIVLGFIGLHLAGVGEPYHQDEYKWVYYSHPEIVPPGTVPHTPLTEFIYGRSLGPLVGDNNFRFIPFGFGFLNLFLLFYLVKTIFANQELKQKNKIALWSVFLFTISFYSLLASLMVDVDGTVMPFFFLIMAIGYTKLRNNNFDLYGGGWKWVVFIIIGAIGGFLVKVSGAIPIIALALDFAICKGVFQDKKKLAKYAIFGMLVVVLLVLILFLAKYVFPFFNLAYSFNYWKHFANSSSFIDRGWLQTFIQFIKSILYTSPLLILPVFFVDKEIWQKTRPIFNFLFIGIIFYLFAFDFSIGALDRYMQFMVIPLCIVSGVVFSRLKILDSKKDFILPALIGFAIFCLQFIDQFVPSLYPKTEWINRVISLKWNFLFPFTGGSGPLPFYVSFLFIGLIWVFSLVLAISYLKNKNIKNKALIGILILGIIYNAVFIEEHLFGKINGNSRKSVETIVNFISSDQSVKNIVVYNDNGGFEVQQLGRYTRRMYAAPQFEGTYREFLKDFSGTVMYVDIPRVGDNNLYSNYLNSCNSLYELKDKYITSRVLTCGPLQIK